MADPTAAAPSPSDWALGALAVEWLQPVNLVLFLTVFAVVVLLVRLQRRSDVDFATMLRDDNEKLSFIRLAGIGCFASSTWIVMHVALDAKPDVLVPIFVAYVAAWSGSAVAVKFVEAWGKKT